MAKMKLGADFRCHMQEEARSRNERCNGEFVEISQRFSRFLEEGLALQRVAENGEDDDGYSTWNGYRRIPGKTPQVTFEDISLFDLAAETVVNRQTGEPVGRLFVHEYMNPDRCPSERYLKVRGRFQETGEVSAVDWSMFQHITGPMLFNDVMKGMESEEFVFTKMAGTYPTQFIAGERYPGVSQPFSNDTLGLDRAQLANSPSTPQMQEDLLLKRPGKEFAKFTMGENYLDLPATELRGGILDIDRTAIYSDRTGLISKSAQDVGNILGKRKEIRGLQFLTGIDTTAPYKECYNWDGGIAKQLDIWQSATGTTSHQLASASLKTRKFPFVNDVPSNPLNDYTTFKESDLAFSQIVDPNDGWPLSLKMGQDVFFPYSQRFDVARITNAFQVYQISQGLATGGQFGTGSIMTASPNPVNTLGTIRPNTSRLLSQVMLANPATYAVGGAGEKVDPELVWFTGEFKEIKYMENWPVKVIQRPSLSEAEFLQDVVLGFRADERGRWTCFNPRKIQRNNFESQSAPTNEVPGE